MKRETLYSLVAVLMAASLSARAEVLERQSGIKIGERMTLRPYVSMSATYDSNVRGTHDDEGDVMWTISPALGLSYDAENWSLLANAFYSYRAYSKSRFSDYNRHSYGEDLRWNWANSKGAEKGWTLIIAESFQQITAVDDLSLSDGRGYSQDMRQFQISGAAQRRFNEHWHGDVNASYYWMDYMNDIRQGTAFYGWDRWQVGGEIGYAPSPWTDIILAGGYQGYSQDNVEGSEYSRIDGDSHGWTVQMGLGSYMTERISYRVLAGWSRFEYGEGALTDDGFVYTISGNWKIGETWNTMLLASSYYQPSERQQASASRVDALSWGLAKMLVRGKLRATLDVRYRHETNEYALTDQSADYTLDILTGRVGFDYFFNRIISCFVYGEYQKSWNDESSSRYNAYDYDRWRITCGFRLSY